MKKTIIFFSLLFSTLLFIGSCGFDTVKDGEYRIKIYATNDLHGRFFDSLFVAKDSTQTHPYSLGSIASAIKGIRQSEGEENVILLDVGDHLQGDNMVFYYNFVDTLSSHIFSKVVNYLDYDAVVVGNHDIEAGHAVYDKLVGEMEMPYLAANAVRVNDGKPYFKPYTIIERHGLKIAVIGMTNPNIPNWLSKHLWEGMEFLPIEDNLKYWVDYVKKNESPNVVIAALHSGVGFLETPTIENASRFVAKNIDGLDIVFAAHDHKVTREFIENNGKKVLLLEGGSRGAFLSAAYLDIVVRDGEVTSLVIDGETLDMSDVSPDQDYSNHFREEFLTVKSFTNAVVGKLLNDISTKDAYFGSSSFIDLIHSVQLEVSGADVSFAAPLSFAISKNAGELKYQDLLDIYPYENQLYVISMSGNEIKNYLEYSYSKWVNKYPSPTGHMLQIKTDGTGERGKFNNIYFNFDAAAGLVYEVDITKGNGKRVTILSMADGSAFDFDKRYSVALSSYRASGGGDMLLMGAGIDKHEVEERFLAKHADIRSLMYEKLTKEGSLEAKKLDNWKFVPEDLVNKLKEYDYKVLFN
ncbi:MAG: bifunctional UDP-sugar hydrolase/5'-nucleotidase [Bacteroidales bacterium]